MKLNKGAIIRRHCSVWEVDNGREKEFPVNMFYSSFFYDMSSLVQSNIIICQSFFCFPTLQLSGFSLRVVKDFAGL